MNSYDISLERILGFSEGDLEANRRGEMTATQVQKLHSLKSKYLFGIAMFGGVGIPLFVITDTILLILPYLVTALPMSAYNLWKIAQFHSDVANEGVVTTVSPFRLSMFQYKYQRTFFIHLGKMKLTIPEHVHHHLQLADSRAVYRWYYTKKSRVLLSAELLPW